MRPIMVRVITFGKSIDYCALEDTKGLRAFLVKVGKFKAAGLQKYLDGLIITNQWQTFEWGENKMDLRNCPVDPEELIVINASRDTLAKFKIIKEAVHFAARVFDAATGEFNGAIRAIQSEAGEKFYQVYLDRGAAHG